MPLKLPLRRHVVSGRKSDGRWSFKRLDRVIYLAVALVMVKHRMIIRLRIALVL